MKSMLRPATPDETILREITHPKSREIVVNPDGGFFDCKTLAAALRKAGPGDIIVLPEGEHPGFELRKNIVIRAAEGTVPSVRGTIRLEASQAAIFGITLRAAESQPALRIDKGTLLLRDSSVSGSIEVGGGTDKARLVAHNCLLGGAPEGLLLSQNGALEMSGSRLAGCRVGITVRNGAECALYHSRIEGCRSADEADPGAGIFAEQSTVYCEGVTLHQNGVGAYLQSGTDARIFGSSIAESGTAALIATGASLRMISCVIGPQESGRCAQIAIEGGSAEFSRVTIHAAPASALSAGQARLDLQDVHFAAREETALDLRSCELSGAKVTCQSSGAAGLHAAQCHGVLRDSTFAGLPPTRLADSPQLQFESCQQQDAGEPLPDAAMTPGANIEAVLDVMRKRIGQHSALAEIERILRLAHAARQRRSEGLPVPQQSFHCVFMGPRGCGKVSVARRLAEGLHAMGVVPHPEVAEVSLLPGAPAPNGSGQHGVIFLRAREATGSAGDFASATARIEHLLAQEGAIVILEGDREDIRRVLRSSLPIERAFRNTLFFHNHGPADLAAIFAEHCERDRIVPSPGAKEAILLMFHIYSDRKDKRFATEEGVELLYETTRRRYLERSSRSNRIDLPLEPCDLELPQDRALRNAQIKSPAFITFCPSCRQENPWVAGLDAQNTCLHCGTAYAAEWGIWQESTTYRRLREALVHSAETGAVTRRAILPMR